MTDLAAVLPPLADGGWNDPVVTMRNVLTTLRMPDTDPEVAVVTAAMNAAVAATDQHLDRVDPLPGPPPPAPVQQAVEMWTLMLYRRKDAPLGMLNTSLPEDVPYATDRVSMTSVYALLEPYRQRRGVS